MRRRPLIDRLLDIRIRVWRPTTTDDAIGIEEREYNVSSEVNAFISRPAAAEGASDGGLAPVGGVRWYGRPDIDVRVRDVCEVTTGPEVGKTFEVNAPPVRPKNHHTEVDCIEWHGILPTLG